MQQERNEMSDNRSNFANIRSGISEAPMSRSAATVHEMRDIVGEAVNARRDRGQSEAVFQAARDLGLSTRRVLGLLRGEVPRVWADEYMNARRWHAEFLARQAARSRELADEYERRVAALKREIG